MICYLFENQTAAENAMAYCNVPKTDQMNPTEYPDQSYSIDLPRMLPLNPIQQILQQKIGKQTPLQIDAPAKTAGWYDIIKADSLKDLTEKLNQMQVPKDSVISIGYEKELWEFYHYAVVYHTIPIQKELEYARKLELANMRKLKIRNIQTI